MRSWVVPKYWYLSAQGRVSPQRTLQAELTKGSAFLRPQASCPTVNATHSRYYRLRKPSQSILAHRLRVGIENLPNVLGETLAESTEVKIVGTPDKQCWFQVSVAGVKLCPPDSAGVAKRDRSESRI